MILGRSARRKGSPPVGSKKQKFPHTARHSVDFVQLEFERFSSWTFLIEEIEAMTAAQIANLSDEVNEVRRAWHSS